MARIPALSKKEDNRGKYIIHCMLMHEDYCLANGIHENSHSCPANKIVNKKCIDCGCDLMGVDIKTKRCPSCVKQNYRLKHGKKSTIDKPHSSR